MDQNIIEERILRIRKNLRELEKLRQVSERDFLEDYISQSAAERLLETSIQAAIDIGAHLIAEKRLESPAEYRQVFEILGKHGLLPLELVTKLVQAAGLRNRLAHAYLDLDSEKIHQFLHSSLGDFEEYCRIILTLIQKD
ncbi:MAG TPA: DUF86 domain-containing protein [Deltaproteobacteria bacterium]|nr:DUF86 domain-containing protein [Deltaproteobacteria bacterium]